MLSRALRTNRIQRTINQSISQSISQKISQNVNQNVSHFTSAASASRPNNIKQPNVTSSNNQPTNQSINQSDNQSVNQSNEEPLENVGEPGTDLVQSMDEFSPLDSKPAVDRFTYPTHLHGYPIDQSIDQLIAPTFSDLKLPLHTMQVLEKANINAPTIIQSAVIPLLMRKPPSVNQSTDQSVNPAYTFPDLIINEQTGEGKTLAYLLPMLSQVTPYQQSLQSIIIVPSRELAVQVKQTIDELTPRGKKARARNPIRVELAVGDMNPYLISQLTKAKPVDVFHPSTKSLPHVPPRDFVAQFDDQLPIQPSDSPHILVGTPKTLHDLLVTKGLLDCRSLKYIVLDEIDALINRPNSQPYLSSLIALRSAMPSQFKKMTIDELNRLDTQQLEMLKLHPRTQVVLSSATVTPPVLSFASVNLSKQTKLITAASLPGECERLGRKLMIGPALSSVAKTSRNASLALTQLPQLPTHVTHHFATLPAGTRMRAKADMLLQLCLAIRSSYRHMHPELKRPSLRGSKIIRTENSHLKGGLNSVPPSRWSFIPQTTMVMFTNPHDIFPILPHLTTGDLRVTVLSSLSSRTERRDAFSMSPPPDILLCEAALASRGLDFKCVTHVVNWTVPPTALEYIHRAGRVSRKHSVNATEGTVISLINEGCGDEERVARIVRAGGGRALSQMVVRGDRLYSRHRATWRPLFGSDEQDVDDHTTSEQSAPNDEDEHAPSFVEQLMDRQAVKAARRPTPVKHSSSNHSRVSTEPSYSSSSHDHNAPPPRHSRGQRSAPSSSSTSSFEHGDESVKSYRGTNSATRKPEPFRNYANEKAQTSRSSR